MNFTKSTSQLIEWCMGYKENSRSQKNGQKRGSSWHVTKAFAKQNSYCWAVPTSAISRLYFTLPWKVFKNSQICQTYTENAERKTITRKFPILSWRFMLSLQPPFKMVGKHRSSDFNGRTRVTPNYTIKQIKENI